MSARVTVKKEKMPTKVFYNLGGMIGPNVDPKQNIIMGPEHKHRVSRKRSKLSPNASTTSSRKYFLLLDVTFMNDL